MTTSSINESIQKAIVWCLVWGPGQAPRDPELIAQLRDKPIASMLKNQGSLSNTLKAFESISKAFPQTKKGLESCLDACPELWTEQIGLVYGGATKIKQYVFESSKLMEVRGASALLDRINLVDLPAFFKAGTSEEYRDCKENSAFCNQVHQWLDESFPSLADALIPELIVYTSGGNILAMCPPAFTQDLAAAIEQRYIFETITANACATGETFKLVEFALGLLPDKAEQIQWVEWYQKNCQHPIVEAYYGRVKDRSQCLENFQQVKSFNELVRRLANLFNQRRSGFDADIEISLGNPQVRPSRAFPPMLETHPYLHRDLNDKRGGVSRVRLPGEPIYSDPVFRKRRLGEIAKGEKFKETWFNPQDFIPWEAGGVRSWVNRFTEFLETSPLKDQYYLDDTHDIGEALNFREIGNASKPEGYIAYIYADGNNMGGYIQKKIRSAADYRQFSKDVSEATEKAVYIALAQHLHPHTLKHLEEETNKPRNGERVHPFEILTIGGDDVLLMVPASQALAIAKTLCEAFEKCLLELNSQYHEPAKPFRHRYQPTAPISECSLSMSSGVLLTSDATPIYYAESLTNQLLKSAKHYGKSLTKEYHGGTIDFLVLKGVNMISSNIKSFRENGLEKQRGSTTLKLYGAPYTLHEIDGLIQTVKALKESDFPRSQLYQIRSLLEQGKKTAILNYRYFRVKLKKDGQQRLKTHFENAWCKARENDGNLAPWIQKVQGQSIYETNWRELVDLYAFIPTEEEASLNSRPSQEVLKK